MILSTDATAVANAIGQFSESNVVAQSITNLINREKVAAAREQEARRSVEARGAAAVAAELEALLGEVDGSAASKDELEQAYLRVLNSIGAALGRASAFRDVEQAEAWLEARRGSAGGQAR